MRGRREGQTYRSILTSEDDCTSDRRISIKCCISAIESNNQNSTSSTLTVLISSQPSSQPEHEAEHVSLPDHLHRVVDALLQHVAVE